jgi:SAM-dependent methyltransferase
VLGLDIERTSFLDVGTGNGHFLFRLREPYGADADEDEDDDDEDGHAQGQGERKRKNTGFQGPIVGTDYSQKSIEFAQRIAQEMNPQPPIAFLHYDIMTSPASALLTPPNENGYDVVLDKGTFDAISLSDQPLPGSSGGKRLCEGYIDRILPLVREGGVFVVTSCNWTEEELRGWFDGGEFVFETGLKYRSFRFGGREGQSISSVCFRRKRS